jgi:hypothetical protein
LLFVFNFIVTSQHLWLNTPPRGVEFSVFRICRGNKAQHWEDLSTSG